MVLQLDAASKSFGYEKSEKPIRAHLFQLPPAWNTYTANFIRIKGPFIKAKNRIYEVKIAVADEGRSRPCYGECSEPEKMEVFKDPLPSHAPVATTPEVSAFPTQSDPS